MDNILDNDGLGLDTTFTTYVRKGDGGIISFVLTSLITVCYMALTIVLAFYSFEPSTLIIMIMVLIFNVSHTVHKYLVWRHNKIDEHKIP